MSNIGFRMMATGFKIRDYFSSRQKIVSEVGLKSGFHVLDYGCGPGGYVLPVSKAIGSSGVLYALDVMPIAIEMVKKIVTKNSLTNVRTILSDCATGLPDEELDAVLLYDVFHGLGDKNAVLSEIHRVLKPDGILSFSDHHLGATEILSKITGTELFKLQEGGEHTYRFVKRIQS